jgi:hypothetical protein
LKLVGVWRSLVAHLHGVQGVEGSNPFTPTNFCLFWSLLAFQKRPDGVIRPFFVGMAFWLKSRYF